MSSKTLKELTDALEEKQQRQIYLLRQMRRAIILNEMFGTGNDVIAIRVVRSYRYGRFLADKIDTVFIRVNDGDKFEATREQIQELIDQEVISGSLSSVR